MITVQQMVIEALENQIDPGVILNDGMVAAMGEVGRRFEVGDFYVPETLIAARAMQAGMSILMPYLVQDNVQSTGKVLIGTVKGDLHDIGKNLVKMMLEGAGFEIRDLGTNVSPEEFMISIKDYRPDIIALSALLTTTMPNMKAIIDIIKANSMRDKVKVIIGGAPVTEEYAQKIGADGYAPDASRATSLARSLMKV